MPRRGKASHAHVLAFQYADPLTRANARRINDFNFNIMTKKEFIQQAVLKMLPPVFDDMVELNRYAEKQYPDTDYKPEYKIVIEQAISLARTLEERYIGIFD